MHISGKRFTAGMSHLETPDFGSPNGGRNQSRRSAASSAGSSIAAKCPPWGISVPALYIEEALRPFARGMINVLWKERESCRHFSVGIGDFRLFLSAINVQKLRSGLPWPTRGNAGRNLTKAPDESWAKVDAGHMMERTPLPIPPNGRPQLLRILGRNSPP